MKRVSILILLLGATFANPTVDQTPKIVGGNDAIEHEAPYMISLQVDRQGNGNFVHTCGSSILNPNWILTAAHCITENGLNLAYQVVAGQHNLVVDSGREQRRNVARFEIHENFVSGPVVGPWDIALLNLESPLVFVTGVVEPINLPLAGAVPSGEVQLFGWGSTSQTGVAVIPDILQTARKPIIALDLCREVINTVMDHEPLHYTNVCTGPLETIVTACVGDSGGPIVQGSGDSRQVVGIASWISHFPCGAINAVSVYVRVSAFIDWINERVN